MLRAECLFGLLGPAESCRKPRALAAEAQVARHGTEREQSPVSPPGRGANSLLVSTSDLLLNQSCSAYIHTSSMFGPVCFFSFSVVFFCMVALVNHCKETRTGGCLNWEWIYWNFSTTRAIFISADGPLLLFEQLCSGTEVFPLLFTQLLFRRVWVPAM